MFGTRRSWLTIVIAGLAIAAVPARADDSAELTNAIRALDAGDTKGALSLVQRYALDGNHTAQNELGWVYETGHGVPVDYHEAMKWYRLSALSGAASDQNNLGRMYESGLGVARNYAEAEKWYGLSALQDFPMGEYDLAFLHDRRLGAVPPFAQTLALYKKAADQGLAVAQYQYALSAKNGHVTGPSDANAVALDYLQRAGNQGYGPALDELGRFHELGRGVPQNHLVAFDLYRRGAEAGDARAMAHLAALYETGRGVARSYPQAVRWYRRAADRNSAPAAYRLGLIAEFGLADGVRDYAEGFKWVHLAADAGNLAEAQNHLGEMYGQGHGVAADATEAARWFRRAAAQNLAAAMANLAQAYQTGAGVPADPAEARRWRELAAAHGYSPPASKPAAGDAPPPAVTDLLSGTGTASTTGPSAATCRQLLADIDECRKLADQGGQCYEARKNTYEVAGCR
ncbi:MAG TPA: tetratricopeptide repeat protein [Aliidongia sp.]|nr:tetratricopeptide repeat protein [Aliidongia sp.]